MNLLTATVRRLTRQTRHALLGLFAAAASLAPIAAQGSFPAPTLPPGAEALAVPAGHVPSFRTFAAGVQVYRWNTTTNAWTFVEPIALLVPLHFGFPLGFHSVGPTWNVPGAGSVVGTAVANRTVDPNAIPWLLLSAVSTAGTGPLAATTFLQRLHTVGGRAPARAGAPNEVVQVPYTAVYYFYRAQ
jgi:hypothetical protein